MDPQHRPCARRLASALFIAMVWGLVPQVIAADFPGENTVVRLSVDGRSGTGFIVALASQTAYILTAKHVLDGSKWSQVEFVGDPSRSYQAETHRVDGTVDAALLRVTNPPASARALAIFGKAIEPGTEALVLGFPNRSLGETLASATFSRSDGSHLSLTGLVDSGSSGSPILLKDCETATGLITKVRAHRITAIPGPTLLRTLRNWLPETPLPQIRCAARDREMVRISFPLSPVLRKSELYIDGERAVPEANSSVAVLHILIGVGEHAFEWRRNDGGRCRFARMIREPEVMTPNCTWEISP